MTDSTPRLDTPAKRIPLTPEQLAHFAERFLREREGLTARIISQREQAPRVVDPTQGLDHEPEQTDAADTALAFGTLCTQQQDEINDAFLRIELGEYGTCEVCGNPIELERLEAHPTEQLCGTDALRFEGRRRPKL